MVRVIFAVLFILLVDLLHAFSFSTGFEPWVGVVGRFEATKLLELKKAALNAPIEHNMSINMGKTTTSLILDEIGVRLGSSSALLMTWDQVKKVGKKESRCYALYDDGAAPWHVSTLSENTGIPASLCPPLDEQGAPTIILGGFTMHRLKGDGMNPLEDTANKLSAIRIRKGAIVLDTCMGAGYTAIGAAKATGPDGHVTTIEYDDASVAMCAHNPWSQELFDGSMPIDMLRGDSTELIRTFESNSFDFCIHDPPAHALCRTDLYGLDFYKQLHRVLSSSGSMLHYIGNPSSKESGRLYAGIMARLRDAGFASVIKAERAFGVVARK
jgi:predicted methyltransferase